jgi:hypothetical protein
MEVLKHAVSSALEQILRTMVKDQGALYYGATGALSQFLIVMYTTKDHFDLLQPYLDHQKDCEYTLSEQAKGVLDGMDHQLFNQHTASLLVYYEGDTIDEGLLRAHGYHSPYVEVHRKNSGEALDLIIPKKG